MPYYLSIDPRQTTRPCCFTLFCSVLYPRLVLCSCLFTNEFLMLYHFAALSKCQRSSIIFHPSFLTFNHTSRIRSFSSSLTNGNLTDRPRFSPHLDPR
ncbi:hypothetical protein NA56DRAFT_172180 [Hyaloscypha hepaticicola]|uniref:Uncharacterized protein n=1 Tax=Hyaloscypha hepaticicola TaxID=2082293 RepID=A0A2J6Q353_9HELO|nr:hypothetical protein NA56DRAFT_172180 [Hyaloscypha hepaticicola]